MAMVDFITIIVSLHIKENMNMVNVKGMENGTIQVVSLSTKESGVEAFIMVRVLSIIKMEQLDEEELIGMVSLFRLRNLY